MRKKQFYLKPICASLVLVFAATTTAHANPIGAAVVNGQASFATKGKTLTVTNTPGTIINWQGFSIGANEITRFAQQSASSAVLNRVIANNPSNILGSLQSNGRVFLVNPNGIVFGAGSTVNVAGMVASTLNLSNADFLAGRYNFTNTPGAQNISNAGNITAQNGGQIYLIAPNVENTGVINAPNGEILLAAGHSVELVNSNDPNLRVNITAPAGDATNVGQLVAEAGSLGLFGAVVRNSGTVSADSATLQGGKIVFKATQRADAGGVISAQGAGGGSINVLADMQTGTVNVTGKLDASSNAVRPEPVEGQASTGSARTVVGTNGGFIETSAAHVKVADTARVTTLATDGMNGTWLIDPVDFIIAATGGDMTGAAVATALSGGNFSILSTSGGTGTLGNVNVNDVVTWSANKLTLNAQNNININANLNGSGSASLALEYGQASAWGGGNNTYNVNAAVNLPAGNNFSTKWGSSGTVKNYTVITGLGAAGSVTATDLQGMNGNLAANYALGSNIDAFTSGWNGGAGFLPVGTFTGTFDGLGHTITWLTINRPATDNIGLFGYTNGTIRNVGLVGGSITGRNQVGGLAGLNGTGTITNSYSTGTVTGTGTTGYVGGLVGYNTATVINSYSTGTVSSGSGNYVGGLVGGNASGGAAIYYSYSTATVSGANNVGGLLGNNSGAIYSSYSTGTVSGSASNVGGLVGGNTGTITNSYSTGGVTGTSNVGGLVGFNSGGTVSNNFWDTITSGWATSAVGTGLTTSAMMTQASYPQAGGQWNFTNTWYMVEGSTRPILRMEYSTTITNAHQLQLIGMNLAANYTLANNLDLAAALANPNDIWGTASVAGVGGATLTVATGIAGGFAPIGDVTTQFTGTFNGLNHTISNLAINRPAAGYVGLFGNIAAGGTVNNLGLLASNVSGSDFVGALAGTNNGNVSNSYVSGGTVNGGNRDVGGLVGDNSGSVSNSYSSGVTVGGNWYAGGLAGENNGTITNTYSSGGTVNGVSYFGGLVGANWNRVDTSYSTNAVAAGGSNGGGLIGWDEMGYINNSFWDVQTSGRATSSGFETGLSTAQMTAMSNFTAAGWDIANTGGAGKVWRIYEGHTAPLLTSFMTPLTLTGAPDVAVTYNGVAQSGASTMPDIGNFFGVAATGTNAGFYNGYYSNQQGYDFTGGNLTINAAALSAIRLSGTRAYDGTANVNANIFTLSGLVGGQTLVLSGVGTVADKNVGVNKPVTLGSLALGDGTGLASNYTFTGGTQTATITAAAITLSTGNVSKTYDGLLTAAGVAAVTGGTLFGGDTLTGGSFAFTDKNAGSNNKTVTASGITVNDGNGGGNYSVSYANNTASTITPAALGVTANAATKTYNGLAYSGGNGVTYTGLVNGETSAVLGGTLAYGGTAQGAINAGSYLITPGGLTSGNYTLSYVDGALTVNKASLAAAITGTPTKVYDGTTAATLAASNYSLSGFVGNEGATVGQTAGAYNSKDVATASTINATLAANNFTGTGSTLLANYLLPTTATGAGGITPAGLTVTANALNKTAGNIDPLLTYMTAGLLAPDTTTSTLGGALARLAGETAGVYQINQGSLISLSANYTMSYVPADFGIVAAAVAAPAVVVPAPVMDTLINSIIVALPSVPFNPPTPPVITQASAAAPVAQAPAVNASVDPAAGSAAATAPADTPPADAPQADPKKDALAVSAADAVVLATTPIAAVPLPVCK